MKLKAAVIGVGYLGQFHAQKIKSSKDVELVGVCDFAFAQAQKVAGELGVTAVAKPEELFGKVDYVHIAASTQSHFELASQFLKQKIPVLVEKPIAATVEQALELCEVSEKYNTLLSVGHIERFNPAFTYLKEKNLKITYLELNRLAPFRVRGSDVSVLHDLTIHDIDLVQWLFESPIADFEISGKKLIKPTYDDVSIRLKLRNGTEVTINNSRITPQIVRNYRAVAEAETIYLNTATLEGEILRPQNIDPFHQIEKIQIAKVDALALEAERFLAAVRGEKPPAITAREATAALILVEKFVERLDRKAAS